MIRIIYSGVLFNVDISVYLYLTTISVAFYLGIGKRKKELEKNKQIRNVLEQYPKDFINLILHMFMCLSIVYYSMWVINIGSLKFNQTCLDISIFFVIIILLYYDYILYTKNNGNPTDVLFNNKLLIILIAIYALTMLISIII